MVTYLYNGILICLIKGVNYGRSSIINVDNPLFLPLKLNTFINTSKDVIILLLFLFRLKSDAVPGRLNQFLAILIDWNILWTVLRALRG